MLDSLRDEDGAPKIKVVVAFIFILLNFISLTVAHDGLIKKRIPRGSRGGERPPLVGAEAVETGRRSLAVSVLLIGSAIYLIYRCYKEEDES